MSIQYCQLFVIIQYTIQQNIHKKLFIPNAFFKIYKKYNNSNLIPIIKLNKN